MKVENLIQEYEKLIKELENDYEYYQEQGYIPQDYQLEHIADKISLVEYFIEDLKRV